ncbi:hypothetical protein DSC45_16930 [Streptomyces sp. YIM 130001]|nr:hypothetical protein DSC45_16930 [Streptomyces sp. YIM 130001]
MAGEAEERGGRQEPELPGSAGWLRDQLRAIERQLEPGSPTGTLREWTDPVRMVHPEPLGHRYLFLVAIGGEERPAGLGLDDAVDTFTAAGWSAHTSHGDWKGGEIWGTAGHGDLRVRIYSGSGPGILTLTGWTPVLFTERDLRQPHFTLSTVGGVLCAECYGWGACMDCEGSGRGGTGGYGRCWCWGGQGGPGACIGCGGSGEITSDAALWKRKQYGLSEPDGPDAFREPPLEEGHDSNLGAFADVAHRTCACGEFRCHWRNALETSDDRLLSRFTGRCQGCGAERAYAFALPYRRLPAPAPPPSPPGCPRCAGVPIPLTGGLHFPGAAMLRAQDLGLVAPRPGGCQVLPDAPNWRCPGCGHDWRDPDGRRHARVVDAILGDLPAS